MSTLSNTLPRAQWAPLSPNSPTSASTVPKRAVGPTNLPSSPAPSHSSTDAISNYDSSHLSGMTTPPASVPMSAQQSQTSLVDSTAAAPAAKQSEQPTSNQLNPPKGAFEGQSRSVSGSKRKFEEDDQLVTPSKRVRTEEGDAKRTLPDAPAAEAETHARNTYFRVRSKPIHASRPHASNDLINLYGLKDVAASLARKDANGEKINKLRKSYENYVKDMSGRDKLRKVNGEMRNLSLYPDEDYFNTNVHGKELKPTLPDDIMSRLSAATLIDGGRLSATDDDKWDKILDAGSTTSKTQIPSATNNKKASETQTPVTATSPTTYEMNRPSRRGAKRKYNDESFEGYGGTFPDENQDAGSPDLHDDEDAGSTAKRKKRRVGRLCKNETMTPTSPLELDSPTSKGSSRKGKKRR